MGDVNEKLEGEQSVHFILNTKAVNFNPEVQLLTLDGGKKVCQSLSGIEGKEKKERKRKERNERNEVNETFL